MCLQLDVFFSAAVPIGVVQEESRGSSVSGKTVVVYHVYSTVQGCLVLG